MANEEEDRIREEDPMVDRTWFSDGVDPEDNLARWYLREQHRDRQMALDKRREYGSADLRVMAAAMEEMLPVPDLDKTSDGTVDLGAYYIEAAIAFYALGKVSRIVGAFSEGRVPDIDSWRDGTIYSMMARRVRESGGW